MRAGMAAVAKAGVARGEAAMAAAAAAAVEPCRAELGAVREEVETKAVAREAAVRVVDHRAVAAVLGGYPEAR